MANPTAKQKHIRGRFAPTPSGFLHLGNIFCSLVAWLHTKSQGGQMVLRIEDLDPQRCPRKNADKLAKDLEWLGLVWDEGAYCSPNSEDYFQSNRSEVYAHFFQQLESQGLVYPCFCSRNELHAAQAPHLSDGRVVYAGTCRSLTAVERQQKSKLRRPSYRLQVDGNPITFTDGHYGRQTERLDQECGDFIVRRSDGVYAYQLAVVADDALMHISEVVRGCDLLSSTPIQLYLYKLLGLQAPEFFHIPLLVTPDGRRLAKRDGDMGLDALRQYYDSPEPIIGYLAYLAGQLSKPEPIAMEDLLKVFDKTKLPKDNIIVTSEQLLQQSL